MAGFDDDRRDGARSGIWKMVYADFTTAMMAFFLVLWLASTASEAQRDLLADFFNPVAVSREKSGADGVLGGKSADIEGASISDRGTPSDRLVAAPPVVAEFGSVNNPPYVGVEMRPQEEARTFRDDTDGPNSARLDELEAQLRTILLQEAEEVGLRNVILIERLPNSIEIQLRDDANFEMFDRGSAVLSPRAQALFEAVGLALSGVPSTVRVTGHTDGTPFQSRTGNWELSSGRANAARRAIETGGLPADRIASVEGRADRELFIPGDPADPRNRRISVNVLAAVAPSSDLLYAIEEERP